MSGSRSLARRAQRTRRWRTAGGLAAIAALLVAGGGGGGGTAEVASAKVPATEAQCAGAVDPNAFASAEDLESMMRKISGFGLRTTASPAHEKTINYLEAQMRRIKGMEVRSDPYEILRWQPAAGGGDRKLEKAGALLAAGPGNSERSIPVAGAVPYSLPTDARGHEGQVVYLPPGQAITPANARGKVVMVDFPATPVPYNLLSALSYYATPDLAGEAGKLYDRGAFADGPLDAIMTAAGRAEAAGVIVAFDFPRDQVRGYFEPHKGTHYRVPAVFVGVDEREQLKALAAQEQTASVAVHAEVDRAMTRNLIATLPGKSPERIVIDANTDGNTWVQENGVTAMVALARYFSRLPLECRPRTFEFVFATAHLHISREGTVRYATQLDRDYDAGTVAFAFAIEHLGTREIVPVPRDDGPGRQLEFTGRGEPFFFFSSESQPLYTTAIDQTQQHQLDRTFVMKGVDAPNPKRVPVHCSFGGIGGSFHDMLIPTLAMISGPWSLWAPSFGAEAVDFERARQQALTAGDAILALQGVPREQIAGPFIGYRQQRAAGAPTCPGGLPPEVAPGPGE
jgi:hypothetical protein